MKKCHYILISFILIIAFICTSCSSSIGVLNNSLNQLKKGNIENYCSYLDSDSNSDLIISYYKSLNEDKVEIIKNIYSFISFSISEKKDINNVVTLSINCINIRQLMNDVSDRIAMSGDDVVTILNSMISNNTLELNYITRYNFDVRINVEGNKFSIPYNLSVNKDLYNTIYILELIRWLANV